MKLLSALLLSIFAFQMAYAVTYKDLGDRPSTCQKTDGDDFEVMISEAFTSKATQLFENDQLTQVIISNPDCFRVGTEVRLNLENQEVNYLGRGFIETMDVLSSSGLSKKDTLYSKTDVKRFIKKSQSKSYGVLDIKVTEKVSEACVDQQWERLPTCFSAYGDWETFRLPADGGEATAKSIAAGKTKAIMWNGVFNCYKVGTKARIIVLEDKKRQDWGSILPTQLYVVHYNNISKKHANLLGESLTSLKKRMAENKNVDGGYVTMVVFDYLKPEPKKDRE